MSFGTVITPSAADPVGTVALAVALAVAVAVAFAVAVAVPTERAGRALVTFQGHPYRPCFLDAWTLLTWVGAHTTRVQLAKDVHNLPLRPPAVLTRTAASLDLLTGGRLALGLGTGRCWDAIVAMGADGLAPLALDDGIDTFLVATDDSSAIARLGETVTPATRARGRGPSLSGTQRPLPPSASTSNRQRLDDGAWNPGARGARPGCRARQPSRSGSAALERNTFVTQSGV